MSSIVIAQQTDKITGEVVNSSTGEALESVNIVNLNQVVGTATIVKVNFKFSQK